MGRVLRWVRGGALAICTAIAVLAVFSLFGSFLWPYSRQARNEYYRPCTQQEIQEVADTFPSSPEIQEFAAMSSAERQGRVVRVQVQMIDFGVANGGVGYSYYTFSGVAYGPAYTDAAEVRQVWMGVRGYPHLTVPKKFRVGWPYCGLAYDSQPIPQVGPESQGVWQVALPIPLVLFISAPWPLLRLRRWIRERRMRRLSGFEILPA